MRSTLLIRLAVAVTVVLAALQSAGQSAPGFGTYSYDGAGNITAAGGDRFVYDELGRIRSATLSDVHTQELTYDRYGNIRKIVTSGDPYPAVPAVNEATNRIDLATSTTNMVGQYDAAGNLITYNGTDRFTYDALNVMTESTVGAQRRLYLYTASNERIAIVNMAGSTATSSTWTLRDASAKVLRKLERDAAGTWRWEEDYIYRGSQMLAAEVPGNTLHFHLDHLGTPRVITGNGGARISAHTYYPFGRELTSAAQDNETKKFTGHERDAVNLDYMHARSYLPWTGRFLSVDPVLDVEKAVREPQRWNRYAYVLNNPVKLIDPDGRDVVYADDYSRKAVEATRQISPGTDAVVTAFEQDSTRVLRFAEGDAPDIGGGLRIGETRTRKESDPNAKPREFIVILDKKDIDKTKADKRFVVIHEVVGHVKPNSERAMKDQGTAQQREKAAQQRTAEEIRKIPKKSRPRVPRDQEQP